MNLNHEENSNGEFDYDGERETVLKNSKLEENLEEELPTTPSNFFFVHSEEQLNDGNEDFEKESFFSDKLPSSDTNEILEDNFSQEEAEGPGEIGREYLQKLEAVNSFLPTPPKGRPKHSKLTIMIVGESGLGKTTFINTFFKRELLPQSEVSLSPSTVSIEEHNYLINNDLDLTIIDTPGYGDSINYEDRLRQLVGYIERRLDQHHKKRFKKFEKEDMRIHCCFYFIAAHRLKKIDIEFMRFLQLRVNVIPIIAKADTMTTEELLDFKKQILNTLIEEKIQIYQIPERSDNQDQKNPFELFPPYAVIGSKQNITKGPRGRSYPWGCALVEDKNHCDVAVLREKIMGDAYFDLKDKTDQLFIKYMQESKLMKWLNNAYFKVKNHASGIIVLLLLSTMILTLLLMTSWSQQHLTQQHKQFLEGEVGRLKRQFQEEHKQELASLKTNAETEAKKKRLELEQEIEDLRRNATQEIEQMKLQAEREFLMIKNTDQYQLNTLLPILGGIIIVLASALASIYLELRKYRTILKKPECIYRY